MRCQSVDFAFLAERDDFVKQGMFQMVVAVGVEVDIDVVLVLKSSERQNRKLHVSNYELDGGDQTREELEENFASAVLGNLGASCGHQSESSHLVGQWLKWVVGCITQRNDVTRCA